MIKFPPFIKTGMDVPVLVDNPTGSGILTQKKELPGVFLTGVRKKFEPSNADKIPKWVLFLLVPLAILLGVFGGGAKRWMKSLPVVGSIFK